MSLLARLRWQYEQKGLGGMVLAAVENPSNVVALSRAGGDHFYDLELPVFREDVVTVLRPLVEADDATLVDTWRELEEGNLPKELESAFARTDERPDELHSNWRELLYTAVRLAEPETVVETGVFDGLASAYILAALERNDGGELVSIDIDDQSRLPKDLGEIHAGWVVPERLQDRWDCRFGDARELLPVAVQDRNVDCFVHDSLHTAKHMRFEFETVIEAMPDGGLLFSDNVRLNDAFWAFAKDHLVNPVFWKNTKYVKPGGDGCVDDRMGVGLVDR